MRQASILLLVALLTFGCKEKENKEVNFQTMMGKGTSLWDFVVTEQDKNSLSEVEALYNVGERREAFASIPRTLHYIWLGPKEFPKTSLKNVISWIRLHPDWQIKFWTDRPRITPHPRMEVVQFDAYPFKELASEYRLSDNWAERSDLLRYEILKNEGGIYVDHDVECYKSLDPLSMEYDFFCGVEPPHAPIMDTSISITNNLIAAAPEHPIFDDVVARVKGRWQAVEKAFPGKDVESTIYRVGHRSFNAFNEAVRAKAMDPGRRNGVFPASYFNKIEGGGGIYAHHFLAGTWYKNDDPFEHLVRKQLAKVAKKSNKMLLLCGASLGLNLLLALIAIYALRRKAPQT
ncbi:MAG: hypothetical protein MRY21_01090 [Simkaniaceae bacterium]|nr:hypothetical protein [Simkaniaceae bacterium]